MYVDGVSRWTKLNCSVPSSFDERYRSTTHTANKPLPNVTAQHSIHCVGYHSFIHFCSLRHRRAAAFSARVVTCTEADVKVWTTHISSRQRFATVVTFKLSVRRSDLNYLLECDPCVLDQHRVLGSLRPRRCRLHLAHLSQPIILEVCLCCSLLRFLFPDILFQTSHVPAKGYMDC